MGSSHQTIEKSQPDNPQTDKPSNALTSQLPDLTLSQPIEEQRDQDSPNLKVIDNPLEHRLLEMESQFTHKLDTMQSKIDSSFSGLRDDISELNDSFSESMDRLENSVNRFTTTVKWYIAIAGGTAVVVIALLLWNVFFD